MPNYETLASKINHAFGGYLETIFTTTPQINTLHEDTVPVQPGVTVNSTVDSEMHENTGLYRVSMEVKICTTIGDTSAEAHEILVGNVQSELVDFAAIKTALNKPSSGPDNREVKDVHIYNIRMDGVRPGVNSDDNVREDVVMFEIVAMGTDGV